MSRRTDEQIRLDDEIRERIRAENDKLHARLSAVENKLTELGISIDDLVDLIEARQGGYY